MKPPVFILIAFLGSVFACTSQNDPADHSGAIAEPSRINSSRQVPWDTRWAESPAQKSQGPVADKEQEKDTWKPAVSVFPDPNASYQDCVMPNFMIHQGELPDCSLDSTWYSLAKTPDGSWSLTPFSPIPATVFDPILDQDSLHPTGIRIHSEATDSSWLYLSGQFHRRTGMISALPFRHIVLPEDTIRFDLKGKTYQLYATGRKKFIEQLNQWYVMGDYQLFLTAEKNEETVTQLICSWPVFDDSMIEIMFAGDLDQDGSLDLILDNSPKYNSFRPTIYLSGRSPDSLLVHVTAMNAYVGC